jgi:hypothetical protein
MTEKKVKNEKNLEQFKLKTQFRFELSKKSLPKNLKEIISLDKKLFNDIKFNMPLISLYRGVDDYLFVDRYYDWEELCSLITLLCNVDCSFLDYNWYVDSITLGFVYDAIAVNGCPDYNGYKDQTLNTLSKNLYDKLKYHSLTELNMERISRKKYTCVVNWFIHYLLKVKDNKVMAIKYTRDESFRSTFNVDNYEYSYSILLRLIDYLIDNGMVINFNGNVMNGFRVSSMIIVNPAIFEFIGSGSLTQIDNEISTDTNDKFLKVTCEEGNEIKPEEITDLVRYNNLYQEAVNVLEPYHKILDDAKPSINGYVLNSLRLHRVVKETLDVSSRWFDNGCFQNKPKDIRKMLTFFGEETVSLDFKSLHPAILMFYEGISLSEHNPYPSINSVKVSKVAINKFTKYYALDKYDPVRNIVKKLFLAMINADSINAAVGSVYEDMHKDNLKKGTYKEHTMKYVGVGNVDLHKVAVKILKHNNCIAKYLGTGIGKKLQYKDSEIIRKCLEKLNNEKIPCIPVHDSISCRVSDKLRVKEVMRESFIEVIGEGSDSNCIIEEE